MKLLKLGWFLGVSLLAVSLALWIVNAWPPRPGLDLAGGIRLVYDLDRETLAADGIDPTAVDGIDWSSFEQALRARIDPMAIGGSIVRHVPPSQIAVIVPEREALEIDRIDRLITTAGSLEFRVVANPTDHQDIIDLARQQADDSEMRHSKYVKDARGNVLGYWARVGRESGSAIRDVPPLRVQPLSDVIRDADTGQLIELPSTMNFNGDLTLERYLASLGMDEIDVLMAMDDGFDVTGADLRRVSRAWDEVGQPCVNFEMTSRGAVLMQGLTGANLPDTNRGFYRRLGIMLDGTLLSAPRVMSTIADRGRITGSFTAEEVDFLVGVLNAGTLPAPLRRAPIAPTPVPPNPQAYRNVRITLAITMALLLLIWLIMLLRHGLNGLGGILANLVQALLLMAAVMQLQIAFDQPLIVTAAIVAFAAAVGSEFMCELARPKIAGSSGNVRSGWAGLLIGTTMAVLFVGVLFVTGTVLYAVGIGPIRNAGAVLLLGSLTMFLTNCLGLPALIALSLAGRQNDPGTAVT